MLSCPTCHCTYTTTGENQPRLLALCGHTFCYKCLEERRKSSESPEMFQCPQCSLPCTENHVPNITIMKYVEAMNEKSEQRPVHQLPAQQQEAICQACQIAKATLLCFECLPTGFPFCDACSGHEHNRDFPPVQRHSPKPFGAVIVQTPVPTCATHTGKPCLFFSFKDVASFSQSLPHLPSQLDVIVVRKEGANQSHRDFRVRRAVVLRALQWLVAHNQYYHSANQFACEHCRADRDFEQEEFQSIEDSVRRVREQVPNLTRLIRERVGVMQETRAELETLLSRVDEEKQAAMDKVRFEFNQFDIALKCRLQDLLINVESEANIQRKALQDQLDRLEVSQGDSETTVVQASMILQMQDYSYLHQAEHIISSMTNQLGDEDMPTYQNAVATGNIPLHINPKFLEEISLLGVVGGGRQPTELQVTVDKGLMCLSWGKPDDPTVRQYEIEYDLLDRESEIGTKSPVENAMPVSVKVKATSLEKTIDKLIPGKKYNFRIRSLNTAGWGRWSAATTCLYPPFPLTIDYTGEIVEVVIPADGLYCITACGAKAADGNTKKGGRGAIIEAKFLLNKMDRLIILCGGMSNKVGPSTGGGGGTFVAVNKKRDLLIAAGGGGGTRGHDTEDYEGVDANIDSGDGRDGVGVQWANGGWNGECGKDAIFTGPCWGYGGAGFQSASQSAKSFLHGGAVTPGEGGGFGGGGAVGHYGGGGGGGYSGGGGGRGGGGGGSYVLEGGMDVKRWLGNEGQGYAKIVHVDNE